MTINHEPKLCDCDSPTLIYWKGRKLSRIIALLTSWLKREKRGESQQDAECQIQTEQGKQKHLK